MINAPPCKLLVLLLLRPLQQGTSTSLLTLAAVGFLHHLLTAQVDYNICFAKTARRLSHPWLLVETCSEGRSALASEAATGLKRCLVDFDLDLRTIVAAKAGPARLQSLRSRSRGSVSSATHWHILCEAAFACPLWLHLAEVLQPVTEGLSARRG